MNRCTKAIKTGLKLRSVPLHDPNIFQSHLDIRPKLLEFNFQLKPRLNDVVEYRHTRDGLRMTVASSG